MGANCADAPTNIATLAGNVMNHTRVTYIVYPHSLQAEYTAAQGVGYVLGETNSISVRLRTCHTSNDAYLDTHSVSR
jgi:hypothetical protein